MVLIFKTTMHMCKIPLIKLQNLRKRRIHITNHYTPTFCNTRAENLLKGPAMSFVFKNYSLVKVIIC